MLWGRRRWCCRGGIRWGLWLSGVAWFGWLVGGCGEVRWEGEGKGREGGGRRGEQRSMVEIGP